jgi:hypothetical protein
MGKNEKQRRMKKVRWVFLEIFYLASDILS